MARVVIAGYLAPHGSHPRAWSCSREAVQAALHVKAALQKTEADIESTDAEYQYRLTQIVLAFTMASPK